MATVEPFGDWTRARALLTNNVPARLNLAIKQATVMAAILLTSEIIRGIRSQAPGGQAFAPLAQVTIDRKGSSKALIDTGFLINSITHKILDDKAFVGVLRSSRGHNGEDLVNIGAVMEYGATVVQHGVTIIIPARPFLHPVMVQHRERIYQLYRDAVQRVLGI